MRAIILLYGWRKHDKSSDFGDHRTSLARQTRTTTPTQAMPPEWHPADRATACRTSDVPCNALAIRLATRFVFVVQLDQVKRERLDIYPVCLGMGSGLQQQAYRSMDV